MGKSLSQQVGEAVDAVFTCAPFEGFRRHDVNEGGSVRRYFEDGLSGQHEVSIYLDKRWSRTGGNVYVELYSLNRDYQRLIGGCDQSLLQPAKGQPFCHFQHGLEPDTKRLEQAVKNDEDVGQFAEKLRRFAVDVALPWFRLLETPDGIESYFLQSGSTFAAARWQAATGKRKESEQTFVTYILGLPRQIETELAEAVKAKIITREDAQLLGLASIQQASDYEERVREWAASRTPVA